jgi:hypothetical protein
MTYRPDPQDGFSASELEAYEAEMDSLYTDENDVEDGDYADYDEYLDEYDGQPSEYDEWQDFYGGDDWDHGQYDEY